MMQPHSAQRAIKSCLDPILSGLPQRFSYTGSGVAGRTKPLCWVPRHATHLPGGWSWDPYPTCGVQYHLFLRRAEWMLSCSCPASLGEEQHFPALAGVRPWPAGKRQWALPPDPREVAEDRTTVSGLPSSFSLPLCRNCHPHSSASSRDLVCAPTSLAVPGQAPPLTIHQQ